MPAPEKKGFGLLALGFGLISLQPRAFSGNVGEILPDVTILFYGKRRKKPGDRSQE